MEEENSVSSMCRACLVVSNEAIYSIYEEVPQSSKKIVEMLELCSLQLDEDQCLPDRICRMCLKKLETTYEFVETFKKSQELLKEQEFNTKTEEVLIEDHDVYFLIKEEETGNINTDSDNIVDSDADTDKSELDFKIQHIKSVKQMKELSSDDENLYPLIEESIKLTQSKDIAYKRMEKQETYTAANIKIKSFDNPYHYCPVCYKPYRALGAFRNHIYSSHNQCKIICKLCPEKCISIDDYMDHYTKTHQYQCDICEASFPNRYFHRAHQESHTTAMGQYECPVENCSKSFRTKLLLNGHLSTHNTEKKFTCKICNESFKNHDSLRYHRKKHTGPPHLCMYCGKRFWMPGELNSHLQIHKGIKSPCPLCGKAFRHRKAMLSHKRKFCPNRGNVNVDNLVSVVL